MTRAGEKLYRNDRPRHPSDTRWDILIGVFVALSCLGFVVGIVVALWKLWSV